MRVLDIIDDEGEIGRTRFVRVQHP